MITPRRTSVIILITLAELAWLAAFGLLFAYRGKVGELGNIRRELDTATNRLAQWEAKSPDAAELLRKLEVANGGIRKLQEGLRAFEKSLLGKPPEEAAQLLAEAEKVRKRLVEVEEEAKSLKLALAEKEQAATGALDELRQATDELAMLRKQMAALPPNVNELLALWRDATNRIEALEKQMGMAQNTNTQLTETLRNREVGEFSVRRELTGLPDGNLRRVVFLVDTSSSMRNSPAWDSARKLIRTWLEFLPVEECALVNFNDDAVGFPKTGYHRVRQPDGTKLPNQREELIRVFDEARPGTYTDLLRGLRRAYEYPTADVMVLFTDGHPHVATQRDGVFASDIFKEVGKHRGIPILTVALGTYEIEGADGPRPRTNAPVSFLKDLARRTGGNFLAR